MTIPKKILPAIVISQFFCTSLWFAGNAVMGDLVASFNLTSQSLGYLTSFVQFGFIIGTLIFALFTIADRFSPSKVFLACAIFGALFNLGVTWEGNSLKTILLFRFFTGFFLAGIYPVGMKIAADYFEKGLGKSLGYLVGALVLGTALPHLLKDITTTLPWKYVLYLTSSLAIFGGSLMAILVPNGPYRKQGNKVNLSAFLNVFKSKNFRSAAFGYFGHMWELYAFWAFVPIMLKTYTVVHSQVDFNIPLLSFTIIGIGSIACVIGGYISHKFGAKKIAVLTLLLSCLCCIISPLFFMVKSPTVFIGFLLIWGMLVITDSPLFSSLIAKNAPTQIKGTALTIVNCIGFLITIISIQLLSNLQESFNPIYIYTLLAFGPLLGLLALRAKESKTPL